MSPAYFASDWGALEHHTLIFRDPTNKQRRFIPLLMQDCARPDIIAHFAHIDWRRPWDESYNKLLAACRDEIEEMAKPERKADQFSECICRDQAPKQGLKRIKDGSVDDWWRADGEETSSGGAASDMNYLRSQLTCKFPTLLASLDSQTRDYASHRAEQGKNFIRLDDNYPEYSDLYKNLLDLHLLCLLQQQVPNLEVEEKRTLLEETVKLVQRPNLHSFIRHRALLLVSDIALLVADFKWYDYCYRLRQWLDNEAGARLDLGDHWLLSIAMLMGTKDIARRGTDKFDELQKSQQLAGEREHAALNIAEGLRSILVAASRVGKIAELSEERILATSRWIDLEYVKELSASRASQIRLLLLCCDLVNIAKVCGKSPKHQNVARAMRSLTSQAIDRIDREPIKEVAQRTVQLGDNPSVEAWDIEAIYMHSGDFWKRTDGNEFKLFLLRLYDVVIKERNDEECIGKGWESWRDYFSYIGLTSEDPDICKIAVSALKRGPPLTSGGTVSLIKPQGRIHFKSKVEAMDRSADRQRDFDAFVVSAKGEMSTRSFRDWAGGERVTLAIVFTDVVGSTSLGVELRDEAMNDVRRAHFAQSRRLIERFNGREIKTLGDGFMAAFKSADAALNYAIKLQRETGHPQIKIRAGIHIGPMQVEEGDVFGGTVNFAARVGGAFKGEEICLSDGAKEDIDRLGAAEHNRLKWKRHDGMVMKGFPGTFTLWSLRKE
jgi:class 3 adenylate cyclase